MSERVLKFLGLTCYEVACRVINHTRSKGDIAFLLKETPFYVSLKIYHGYCHI